MRVLVKAYGPGRVSPKAEAKIGDLMKKLAVKEGHKPGLPQKRQPWSAR